MFSPKPVLALHIPDGFLSLPVAAVGWLLMAALLALALRQTRDQLGERQVPLIGILAAFVFAAQMINFPVAGGTSGHLLGGALAAILLGPWAALLVMTTVLAVQSFLFQDGGLLALGLNVVNMGALAAFVGYALYRTLEKSLRLLPRGNLLAAGAAAWATVMLAAAATALELAVSGTSPLNVALPAMLAVHAAIGVGEALITVGALAFLAQARPDLLRLRTARAAQGSGWVAAGLVVALAVAFASPLASARPDGLERVAEDKGFLSQAQDAVFELLPDYTVPFIEHEAAATIAAGVVGVLLVAGVGTVVARTTARSRPLPVERETPRRR